MSTDPNYPPYNYFAVASFEVAVRRYPDSNGTSGLVRTLSLTSTVNDSQQEKAYVWFGPFNGSSPAVGTAYFDSSPIDIIVNLPIGEIDLWLDVLKGDRQVYFEYYCQGETSAAGETEVASVALTTEHDPASHHLAAANSARALQPSLH
jgi:hypothetical protein